MKTTRSTCFSGGPAIISAAVWLAACLAACLAGCQADPQALLSSMPVQADPSHPEVALHASAVGATERPLAAISPDSLPICAPQPAAWAPTPMVDEPGVLDGACALRSVAVDSNADGSMEQVVDYTHDANTVTVNYKNGLRRYTRDAQGRVVRRVTEQSDGKQVRADSWVFDAAGRVVEQQARTELKNGKVYLNRVTQTFAGDRLVRRREWSAAAGDGARTDWSYNSAGRLVSAVRRIGASEEPVATAAWTYDMTGRPTGVLRTVKGKTSLQATWTWGKRSELLARNIEVVTGTGGFSGGRLDSYDAPTGSTSGTCYGCGYGYGGNQKAAWADALMQVKDGCRTLPVAVGHGYPEQDYAIDDSANETPSTPATVGGALPAGPYGYYSAYGYYGGYGYYGYGYGYGPAGNFVGHGGIGSNWDSLAVYVPHTSARFAITYDAAGRMIAEALHVTPTDPKSKAPRMLTRRRTYGDGKLLVDGVFDGDVRVRALRFTRDDNGHLVRRALWISGQIADADDWQRDADGRPVLRVRYGQKQPWKVMNPGVQAKDVPTPAELTRVARGYDVNGRLIDLRTTVAGQPNSAYHLRFGYDADGRIISRAQGNAQVDPQTRETWTFDAEGRELMSTRTYAQSPTNNWFMATTFNAAGLRVRSERGKDPTVGATWRELRVYDCE